MNQSEDEKTSLLEEERAALETPLDARINSVDVPPETKEQWKEVSRDICQRYRHLFKNREEAELFSMLPLTTDEQRDRVIKRALELEGKK
jgi:hypothetical protein